MMTPFTRTAMALAVATATEEAHFLAVADASLFPDSLEINPYLTIMALADRAAEAVRADARDLLAAAGTTRTT